MMARPVLLRVHNASLVPVVLAWVPEGGDEVAYATLQPNQVHTQQTFAGHRWRLTRRTGGGGRGGALPGRSDGGGELDTPPVDSTVIFTEGDGVSLISHTLIPMHALQDGCTVRARICGVITVTAVESVRDEAVDACVECLTSIIDDMPEKAGVLGAMGALGVEVAIIGVSQTTTDVPAHAHLKGMGVEVGPARTYEDGTRGLGATVACPVMSVAEENLLPGILVDGKYPDESILVHEFAHTVMHLGLKDTHWVTEIKDAYAAARRSNAYHLGSYCMANADEYWAEMTQAWFGATRRRDVTSGITSRRALMERDPRLAAIMIGVYGDRKCGWTWRPSDGATGLGIPTSRRTGQDRRRCSVM